ncbi:hypothetical protein FIBSPDRAFT_878057 [Athelia psychrophila]|uniref:Uncharacterized protein n=1 Tax=Athelia psychrophila TaxID=1759441 RepID=A0A167VE20_9AGAM|nr:hypothetical protein FIBSPDRAFT_878057 [Fibularhizoctonia sp. CBS 109695]
MPLQCHYNLPTILPSVSAEQKFLYVSCNYDFRVAAKHSEPLSHKQPNTITSPARRRAR